MAIYTKEPNKAGFAFDFMGTSLSEAFNNEESLVFQNKPIRVMTYNVGSWYDGHHNNIPAEKDADYYALQKDIIQRMNPDILFMNEYTKQFSKAGRTAISLLQELGFPYIHEQGGDSVTATNGRCIASRFPISNYIARPYTHGGYYYDSCRVLIHGVYVNLVITHLYWNKRDYRASEIQDILNLVSNYDRFIVAGDFNTDDCFDSTGLDYNDIIKPVLEAGYRSANFSEFGFFLTYTDIPEAYDYDRDVDTVLSSNNIRMLNVHVDETKLHDNLEDRVDHMPLVAEILLEPFNRPIGEGIIPRTLSTVPTLKISTRDGATITSKTEWTPSSVSIVLDGEESVLESDDGKAVDVSKAPVIRGRGNTTWSFPKKPYYLKFNKKKNLFGASSSKKYILLANWMDRTNLRNTIAYEVARRTSLEWAPSGMFVNLELNGNNQGLYYLVEKIEVESGRLEKTQVKYLYSIDVSDPTEVHFNTQYGFRPKTSKSGLPVEVKYPEDGDKGVVWDDVLSESKTLFDETLKASVQNKKSKDVVDLTTFCDWYIVHEVCGNKEPNHPKSCFMYVKKDNKFYAGPTWDFDWKTFLPGETSLQIRQCLFYRDLFNDPEFIAKLKERWNILKPRFETLGTFIDTQAKFISSSEAVNHELWPIETGHGYSGAAITANGDQGMTFQEAVDRIKTSLTSRIASLDTAINAL